MKRESRQFTRKSNLFQQPYAPSTLFYIMDCKRVTRWKSRTQQKLISRHPWNLMYPHGQSFPELFGTTIGSRNIKRVACPLVRALYGHQTSGDDWFDYFDSTLVDKMKGCRIEEFSVWRVGSACCCLRWWRYWLRAHCWQLHFGKKYENISLLMRSHLQAGILAGIT